MHPSPHVMVDMSQHHAQDRLERVRHLRGQMGAIVQAIIAENQRAQAQPDVQTELEHLELVVRKAADLLIELGLMGPSLQAMQRVLEELRDQDPGSELGQNLALFLEPAPGSGWRRATPVKVDLGPADTFPTGSLGHSVQ